jgi:hypothetical protein
MKLFLLFLFSLPAFAANNAVNDACRRLCAADTDCVHKCVSQAELFELKPDFINAVTDWTKKPDDRMRALRSGADVLILELCKSTGWSLENMMICLRSYPTPEVIRNCKRLSPLQEEQVHCVRLGKTEAQIDECNQLVPGSGHRIACLERRVTAPDTRNCRDLGGDSFERMQCLEKAELSRAEKSRHDALDGRIRHERSGNRSPASLPPSGSGE